MADQAGLRMTPPEGVMELDAPADPPSSIVHLPSPRGRGGAPRQPVSHRALLLTNSDGPRRPPRPGGYRRVLIPVLVVAVAAIAAGVAQSRHQAAQDGVEVSLTEQLDGLRLGKLQIANSESPIDGQPQDDQGRRPVTLWLRVANDGEQAVKVEAEGLSGDYAQLIETWSADIAPGATTILTLSLAVDCSAVPAPVDPATGPSADTKPAETQESWVQLRVTAGDGNAEASRAWRYDTLPVAAYSLPGVLTQACTTT